jgi:hypothetical protein
MIVGGAAALGGYTTGFAGFSGEGGSRLTPEQEEWHREHDRCDPVQRAGQFVGRGLVSLGGLTTQVGIGISIGGVGIAGFGALTGNVPAAVVGTRVIATGGQIASIGTLIAAGGATLMALSGSGKEAVVELGTIAFTSRIPKSLGREAAEQAVHAGLNKIVPEIKSCD